MTQENHPFTPPESDLTHSRPPVTGGEPSQVGENVLRILAGLLGVYLMAGTLKTYQVIDQFGLNWPDRITHFALHTMLSYGLGAIACFAVALGVRWAVWAGVVAQVLLTLVGQVTGADIKVWDVPLIGSLVLLLYSFFFAKRYFFLRNRKSKKRRSPV